MTITRDPRFDVTQWGADSDAPINRTQMTSDFGKITGLAAIAVKGAIGDRPPAGTRERLFLVTARVATDPWQLGTLFWDTGSTWQLVTTPKTTRVSQTFSVPGELLGTTNVPGFSVPSPAGQTARLVGLRAFLEGGTSLTCDLRLNGTTVPGLAGLVITPTAQTFLATLTVGLAPLIPNDGVVKLVPTAASGLPRDLSASVYTDLTV